MRKAFTPSDGVLVFLLLAANGFVLFRPGPPREWVEVVSTEGRRVHDPRRHQRLEVRGPLGLTVVELGPAGSWIASSPCPNQLCVRAGKLSARKPLVACLPNRVALRLVPSTEKPDGGVDALAR